MGLRENAFLCTAPARFPPLVCVFVRVRRAVMGRFVVGECDIFHVHLCHVFLCHHGICVHFRRALESQAKRWLLISS